MTFPSICARAVTNFAARPNASASLTGGVEIRYSYIAPSMLLDVFLRTTLLLFFAPLMLFIALAIYLTMSGPVLVRREGCPSGQHAAKSFVFRTDDDRFIGSAFADAKGRDNRFGRFLRNSDLYKLPQLLNLLYRGPLIGRQQRP
jgi:lipopolysaccharide/colanic/teichoic acid biosynthesis glycosyltransferase